MQPATDASFFLLTGGSAILWFVVAFLAHRSGRQEPRLARLMKGVSAACLVLAGLSLALTAGEAALRVMRPFEFRPVEGSGRTAVVERLPGGDGYWEYLDDEEFDAAGRRRGFVASPDARLKVVVLGDSVTFGALVPVAQTFPRLLQDRLAARYGLVSMLNLAVPGYSTLQERIAFERKGAAENPDLVLLGMCPNDTARFTVVGNTAFDVRVRDQDGVPVFKLLPLPDRLNAYLFRASVLYQYLTLAGIAAADAASGAAQTNVQAAVGELERLRAAVAASHARLVVALFPMLNQELSAAEDRDTARFYNEVRRWAAAAGVPLLDLRSALAALPLEQVRVDSCCHLSAAGHDLAAQAIESWLQEAGLLRGCE